MYFTALKINDSTNKMFKIMKTSFGENFYNTDKKLPSNFFDTMFKSITKSIEESRLLTIQ